MRAKGQGTLTIVLVGILIAGVLGLERLGPRAPAQAASGEARSGAWFCPHGGGSDWATSVYLANPGDTDVSARITSTGERSSELLEAVNVPAGGQVRVEVPSDERGSSSFVEFFGGWIAAGWVAHGGSGDAGIGAEPCAPTAGRSWFSSGVGTAQGEEGYLTVMNPFGADAVFDVAIFAAPPRQPVRDSKLTDVTLAAGRSVAIKLNAFAEGEAAAAVQVHVSSGRVAAATTIVSKASGISSVLASPAATRASFMPTISGAGQSQLSLAVPTEQGSVAGALLLTTTGQPRPVGELSGQSIDPASAAIFPVATEESSSVDVTVQEGVPVVAALRTSGPGRDGAATAGAVEPAFAWVVTPTLAGEPARPHILLVNPGQTATTVTLRTLSSKGGPGEEMTVDVPAASVVNAPGDLLAQTPDASVLITSDGSPVVALGTTTSLGTDGLSVFGSAVGVPIPDGNG